MPEKGEGVRGAKEGAGEPWCNSQSPKAGKDNVPDQEERMNLPFLHLCVLCGPLNKLDDPHPHW